MRSRSYRETDLACRAARDGYLDRVVVRLLAICIALFLVGGAAHAADPSIGASPASVELVDAPVDLLVPREPELVPPIRQHVPIEMPAITQLITYAFAPRMDRPPRN